MRLGHQMMIPLIAPRLKPLLHTVQPDLVLSVHPLLTSAVKYVLDQHTPHIPFAMLFSDPMRVHSAWLSERNATAAFAPTQEIYAQALATGFDPSRLHFVGWPVRSQFSALRELPRERVIADLNRSQQWDLDPRRLTIFASSGSEGATHVEETARLVLAVSPDMQVIVAAGANWALYQRCQGVKNLYAFPFTPAVARFMAVAHLMMGRCSPNIMFEALALGKPLLVTSFLPGQEEDNLRFIERHGLGWIALETAQLRHLITDLIAGFPSDCSLLHMMEGKVQEYQRMNATANASIGPHIRALLDGTSQP